MVVLINSVIDILVINNTHHILAMLFLYCIPGQLQVALVLFIVNIQVWLLEHALIRINSINCIVSETDSLTDRLSVVNIADL